MRELHTEIDIAAPKDAVWDVLTNFAAYPDWNPFLRTVAADLRPGASIAMTISVGARTFHGDARMLRVVPERELRWAGPISRLTGMVFRGEHYFIIEELAAGRVRVLHGEHFGGLSLPFISGWMGRALAPAFVAMNVALKHRAETVLAAAGR